MNDRPVIEGKAAELRQAFDRSFASPPSDAAAEVDDLLTIRVAGDPYAIRLRDIAGVVSGRRIVPVPSATPDLLGLAGIRGGVVPVFGLGSILGYGATDAPGWMVLCGVEDAIAIAFSALGGYVRLPRASFHADEQMRGTGRFLQDVVTTTDGICAVISVPTIVASIRNRLGTHQPARE
jgi:chemotaxis signal transduction protein